MKKLSKETTLKKAKNEIYFCENYYHRCITKFYGFMKEDTKITGFIYEYMSNGTLDSFLPYHIKEINYTFTITILARIYEGLEYLYSKSLIHRDLKPANILIDHDFNSYISDFDTIRHPINEEDEKMIITNDIGSILYASPEQEKGENVSYPTDIYSFGLIVYYLIEKKHILANSGNSINYIKNQNDIVPLTSCSSKNIRYLIIECTKYSQSNRIKHPSIKSCLIDEINLFDNFENFLIEDPKKSRIVDISHFIFESYLILHKNLRELAKYELNLNNFLKLLKIKSQCLSQSIFLFNLGDSYQHGKYTKLNYLKAREYYELFAKEENSDSLTRLGDLYYDGLGLMKNYNKAKEYYEMAAHLNNSIALCKLRDLYFNGDGIKQDYLKAKKYYELAAKQNNSDSLNKLGDLYFNGLGVIQNYSIAKEYYELSAKINDPIAFTKLGNLYNDGLGVKQDYSKAKEYYEISSILGNYKASLLLGINYLLGNGVPEDYVQAKEYIDLAAKKGVALSHLAFGIMYEKGIGVKCDFTKAQNNFGLFYQFFLNNKVNAEYMYERSSKHRFALSEYNLGYLFENDGKTEESIEYYKRASVHVDEPLIFRKCECHDKRLEISKNFIICFTNLKLTKYYLIEQKYDKCKRYFKKAIEMLNSNKSYQFQCNVPKKKEKKTAFLISKNSFYIFHHLT
ncbi:hypothetical protein M9Y10_033052 [Tritrichomonas musculus]|uniref:Protein kinase domain-containing protein n=1 Tax=Tritrichomonas musculus TaxID=1915356 RepID=A0ABR2GXP1_9EUKA